MKWVPLGDHSLARACTQAPPWVCTGPSFATHSAFAERPPRAGSAPRAGSPRSQGARRQTGDIPGIIQSIQCVRNAFGMPYPRRGAGKCPTDSPYASRRPASPPRRGSSRGRSGRPTGRGNVRRIPQQFRPIAPCCGHRPSNV